MADGADFARYVDARWPDLVGGLEDEGVAPDDARLAVAGTLLASRRSWARRVRDENVDVTLWAEARERAGLPPRPGEAAPHGVRPFDPRDAAEPWLDTAERARGSHRRRGARRAVAGLAVAAVLAAGWSWWASIPPDPEVREEANTLPVVWYSDGELHLEKVVVELRDVDQFAAVGSGVVARLESGEIVEIDADGEVSDLDDAPAELTDPPAPPRFVAITQYDVVVQAAPVPGTGWAYLLDSSRRAVEGQEEVRLSESGRRALVVCTAELDCEPPVTIVGAGSVRLR